MHIDADNDLLDFIHSDFDSGRPFDDLTAARVQNKRKFLWNFIVCFLNWFEINFKFIYRYKCDDAYEGAILFDFTVIEFLKNRLLIAFNFDDESLPLLSSFSAHKNFYLLAIVCIFTMESFSKKRGLKWHWRCIKYLFLCMIRRKKKNIYCTLLFACWYC